jgi:prepilin-type N-terminal cleavage/methylation domain-containing protein
MEVAMRSLAKEARRQPAAGFSLVELLVVVGIIAIMAAVSIPAIASYIRNYRIRAGAQQVVAELQGARAQAIRKNVMLGVVLVVLDARTYRVVIEDDMTLDGAGKLSGLGGGPAGNERSIAAILTDAGGGCAAGGSCAQAGAVRRLPYDCQFVTAGGVVQGLRFTNLGAACQPGTPGCPAIDTGANQVGPDTGRPGRPPVAGAWMITVAQPTTGLFKDVLITPGGRLYSE